MSLTMMAWGLNGLVGFPFGLLADQIGERQTIFIMAMCVITVALAATTLHASLSRRTAAPAVVAPTLAGGD
jgi:MFS family permease